MLKEIALAWMYALGAFSDDKTHKYDIPVCVIRSIILSTYLITNSIICAGVVRHWNDGIASLESLRDDAISVEKVSLSVENYPERYYKWYNK